MPRRKYENAGHRFMGRPQTARRQTWNKTIGAEGLPDVPDGTICDVTPAPGCTYTRYTWPPRGRGRGESLYSPRRIEAKLRAAKVIEMRLGGHHTWEHIARTLGFKDASGAYRAYKRTFDRIDWDNDRRYELFKQQYGLSDEDIQTLLDMEDCP